MLTYAGVCDADLCAPPADGTTFLGVASARDSSSANGARERGRAAQVVLRTRDFSGGSLFGGKEPLPHHGVKVITLC